MTETVAALKEANIAFDELLGTRSAEKRMRKEGETMVSIRPKVDEAFVIIAKAINTFYIMNEWGPKDAETRTRLETVIDGMNDVLLELETALINAGVIKKTDNKKPDEGEEEETPTPEPVEPAITEVYSKVEDVHDPTGITRGKETIMKWVGDFELVNEAGDGPGKIIVKDNFSGVEEEVPVEDILSRSNTGCEFIMIRDFAEGDYKIRIETYDGGSPLVLEYPEVIKLV